MSRRRLPKRTAFTPSLSSEDRDLVLGLIARAQRRTSLPIPKKTAPPDEIIRFFGDGELLELLSENHVVAYVESLSGDGLTHVICLLRKGKPPSKEMLLAVMGLFNLADDQRCDYEENSGCLRVIWITPAPEQTTLAE